MTRFQHAEPETPQCLPECFRQPIPSGSYYQGLLNILHDFLPASGAKWLPPREPDKFHIPPKEESIKDAEILDSNIQSLRVQNEDAFRLSADRIKIIRPHFLTDSQQCSIENATLRHGKMIMGYAYAPMAAFAAYGYPICSKGRVWLPCPKPQRRFMRIS